MADPVSDDRYGFRVTLRTELEDWEPDDDPRLLGWRVKLPHQCDSWDIAGEYSYRATQDEAIAALEAFIAEAQEALTALKAGQTFGDEDE